MDRPVLCSDQYLYAGAVQARLGDDFSLLLDRPYAEKKNQEGGKGCIMKPFCRDEHGIHCSTCIMYTCEYHVENKDVHEQKHSAGRRTSDTISEGKGVLPLLSKPRKLRLVPIQPDV